MKRYLITFLAAALSLCRAGGASPARSFDDSHDIASLHAWGPYSKRYAGISHIPDMRKGIRFDFSVMPGFYRNRQLVPHVLFESSYYPWEINPEMTRITYRYELEWKDRVYADVTYHLLDDNRILVAVHCVNRTERPQNLVLNQMAYIDYPEAYPRVTVRDTAGLRWYNAVDYIENIPARPSPQFRLVYDGWRRNEERSALSLDGSLVGRGFGRDEGDRLAYQVIVPPGQENGTLLLRFRVKDGETASLRLKGLAEQTVSLEGTGEFRFLSVPYRCAHPGEYRLELVSASTVGISLDGFFVGDARRASSVEVAPAPPAFTPVLEVGEGRKDFILKYKDCEDFYGVAWNYPHSEVREVLNGELESFFRRKVHDHVSSRLVGDRQGHYANAFLRPVVLEPEAERTIYMLVCNGSKEQVRRELSAFHSAPDRFVSQVHSASDTSVSQVHSASDTSVSQLQSASDKPVSQLHFTETSARNGKPLPAGEKYFLGNRLLQASLLSNVVYPVYTQREYIRHFTPGKNWNSLYTWDSGFIALGLIDVDPLKAFECIKAYTTPVGNESAFIHHGTPLPIQMYAYFDLWNHGLSRESLEFLYPRLKQFFDFMVGYAPYSTTRMQGSGLLRTWDYFYNSGGWDDYPPQHALHRTRSQVSRVTPVVTSAYYLRAAKILRLAAQELGLKKDVKAYEQVISRLSSALQTYAWDEESGYYGYVVHDSLGNAKDIFRYADHSNFNRGLDGVTPLVAGICSPAQTERLLGHLFSPDELWTAVGLSTVDQSAPYYKVDGYWNGAVWFPHQWMVWKALLDLGKGEEAYRVAHTALDNWERECRDSYFTFEHFIISSGRGAGWHQFSGLSSPVLNWFAAYYRKGKVSTGFEIRLRNGEFTADYTRYEATLSFDDSTKPHERCMIVCMDVGHKYDVRFNGIPVRYRSPHAGMLEITLPATNRTGNLLIRALG